MASIKPYPMARAQTWGIKPFVIQPPTKKELLDCWISSEDFLAMPETAKRMYARKFQVPNYNKLNIRLLDTMFTKYNEKLPMMDILRWDASGGKKVLECTATATARSLEPRRRGPDHPKYAPWSRYSEVLMDEMLQPSPDDTQDDAHTPPNSPQADSECPKTPPRHDPLYTSLRTAADNRSSGINAHEATNDIWLYDKLQDQETQHLMLVKTFQEALDRLRKAVTDVALLQEQIKAEKAASDCFLDAIVTVCGEEIANDIVKQTERGIKMHNIFPPEQFSDPHLLGLQELYNKSEDGEESESLPVRQEDVIMLRPFAFGAHYRQNGEDLFGEASAHFRQGARVPKNTDEEPKQPNESVSETISISSTMGAPAIPMIPAGNDAQASHPRLKRIRNDESDEDSDIGSVASLLFEEHTIKPPRKKTRSTH